MLAPCPDQLARRAGAEHDVALAAVDEQLGDVARAGTCRRARRARSARRAPPAARAAWRGRSPGAARDDPGGRAGATSSTVPGSALLSTTRTSSTTPVARKPSIDRADRVALRVGHEHDRDVLAVPHGGRRILRQLHSAAVHDDRVRLRRSRSPTSTAAAPSRASAVPRSPTRRCYAVPSIGSIFRSYNAMLDRAAAARRPRGARARPPGRRDRRRRLLRQGPRGARRSRGRRGRLRRRDRRAQHRLVGGVGDAAPRSSTATRSTAAATCTRSRGRGTTRPPYARTGEVETLDGFVLVLSPWAVRNVRFDESLGALPRLRPRLLPAGPRGRAARSSPPTSARSTTGRSRWSPTPRAGSTAHIARGREVGRPHAGDRHRAGQLARARAARRGRARRRARARALRRRSRPRPRARASSSARIAETRGSLSWRLTAPLRPAAAPRRAGAMIAFGSVDRRAPRPTGATREPGIRLAAEPDSAVLAFAAVGSICRSYNLLLDAAAAPRRPRGARARRPAHRDRRPRLLRQGPRGARATRTSRVVGAPARRGVRSDRLVGGRRSAAAPVVPPLPRARRRRAGGATRWARADRAARPRSTPSTASCSCSRRGRCATLRFDEDAAPRPRLRPRLLPAGPRQAGRKVVDRRPARRPPPLARAGRATSRSGSRRTSASPRSGTAGCPARRRGRGLEGARPPRRGRARGRADARATRAPRRSTPRLAPLERELDDDDRRARRGGSPRRCGALNRRAASGR